jgi:hypothetical protein
VKIKKTEKRENDEKIRWVNERMKKWEVKNKKM